MKIFMFLFFFFIHRNQFNLNNIFYLLNLLNMLYFFKYIKIHLNIFNCFIASYEILNLLKNYL